MDSAEITLLNMSREKIVRSSMVRRWRANRSPIISMDWKYFRTRQEIRNMPIQKATPSIPMRIAFFFPELPDLSRRFLVPVRPGLRRRKRVFMGDFFSPGQIQEEVFQISVHPCALP